MPLQIAFLDASTLAPVDLDLSPLEAFGDLTLHQTTTPAQVIPRCKDCEVVLTNKVPLDADTFAACPALQVVLVTATGVNCIDLEAAQTHGVAVCNVAGYSSASVAQHTIALLLNLATNVHRYSTEAECWPDSPIFTRLDHPVIELAGKTLGIVGLGDIGAAVARIAESLGMQVIALQREGSSGSVLPHIPRVEAPRLFSTADALSLHCPLTPATTHLINASTLALMKPSAFLLNASRGPLVDEEALAAALRAGTIAGAGLDVLSSEPPARNNPLLAPDLLASGTLLITPHSAWISRESRQRLLAGVVENLRNFLAGNPTNRVA